jgi:hypothetical protein
MPKHPLFSFSRYKAADPKGWTLVIFRSAICYFGNEKYRAKNEGKRFAFSGGVFGTCKRL